MKNHAENAKLKLEDLQLESFVTSIDSEVASRLAGGLGNLSHPTHTEPTDQEHVCTGVQC